MENDLMRTVIKFQYHNRTSLLLQIVISSYVQVSANNVEYNCLHNYIMISL